MDAPATRNGANDGKGDCIMGLFSSDGRDRNHDGYVSPFDADETQAYVDPSRSLNQDHAEREGGPESSGRTTSDQQTQPKRSSGKSQSQSGKQDRTERRRNRYATIALLCAIVGVAYPAIAPAAWVDPRWIPAVPFVTALFALLAISVYVRNRRNGGLVRAIIALLCAGGLMSGMIETSQGSIVVHPLDGMNISVPGVIDITASQGPQPSDGETRDTVIHDNEIVLIYERVPGPAAV